MFTKNKKAQVAVMDLFIAAVLFGILVTIMMSTWNEYNVKIDKQIEYNDLVIKTFHISDLLVMYHGKPSAWEKPWPAVTAQSNGTPLTTIGLAQADGTIDEEKLDKFLNMTYNETRENFNIERYDYYFQMKRVDGSDFDPAIFKGVETDSIIVSVRRLVIYKNEEAILQFQLEK